MSKVFTLRQKNNFTTTKQFTVYSVYNHGDRANMVFKRNFWFKY